MIADDRWVTVGSANIDKNGFWDSRELNLGLASPKLAKELRSKLWQEHLQDNNDAAGARDFGEGFAAWEILASDNGRRAAKNEPIMGHVHYYNFEEMALPPPYPDARGSKFELL
jgi:phosphatidylserine/phosphatidylglycerophosphate/cardiolipin synthase-like enzyme